MNFNKYQELTARTAGHFNALEPELANWAMGIAGEAGEVCDYLKKVLFHGHELDTSKLTKELGDVLWYVARLSATVGIPLQTVAEMNIAKLKERYPEGFDPERSINRKEEEEEEAV